ncbi:PREDICTED: uncharacterized protein LOC105556620 [Vollenhovia emeryi]|uniref:uncharacterized protein LOC105556620 n=1 Tax=Vollenhovia emeryi TaxID=411798 RepID=UPI0005F53C93|nr:PREDICTED: uncharacterized protein LOC105556620 [Vollenhovia emeryi]
MPQDERRRKLWFQAAHRADKPTKSCYYCCEDHFNLKEDMENYIRFTMMGGPIILKKDVVPHIFDCHPQRNTARSSKPRFAAEKLNLKRTITEVLAESEGDCEHKKNVENAASSFEKCLAKPLMVDRQCSPIVFESSSSASQATTTSKTVTSSSHSEYQPSTDEISNLLEEKELEMKRTALRLTNYFISSDSKNYIGLPSKWLWIIEELQILTGIPTDHIKLIFMKIRKNDTFRRLGDQFGLSAAGASKIFNRNVQKIAHVLQTLIYCPSKDSLKEALPIPFRLNFSNVAGIIDCFEIQIEKPSNALHQALTWSEYKKCNTIKYLICISPDGFIIFISGGYGGRVSDVELFEKSVIMSILPEKSALMADRGFKQIQCILHKKHIELVRPPSVSTQQKSTKEEVLLTKRIASLRIHVERVIRRIREFSILEPHATIDHYTMPYIESVVKIAASLINLQEPVIKT